MTLLLFVSSLLIAAAALVGWVVSVANSAPDINQLRPRTPGQVSEVFGSDGSLLGYIDSSVLRSVVPITQLPLALREATVAIEDRRFFHHGGVDYVGILRAGIRDVFHPGAGIQGASTLTMQLVTNVYLPERIAEHHSIRYKIVQAKLANQLESEHAKAWILGQYLNDVDYGTTGGQTAIGVGAASRMFFDKPVERLDLAQYALLAGLPQAPSEYNPFKAPGLARARRTQVLQAMVTSHYITQAQADAAAATPLQVKANNTFGQHREPFIFDYVKQQLISKFGRHAVEHGGLRVYTTIDPRRQQEATAALLAHEGGPGQPAAALASLNPANGEIQALATTGHYGTGPGETTFNYAWQAGRQTGSAFKVYALMTLIHDYDGDPNTTYYVSKHLQPGWLPDYPTYSVATAEKSYQGVINVTKATWISDNTVFAQLAQDLQMSKVSAMAHAMGITSPLSNYPSEVLGAVSVSPLQMADGYATIADGGVHHPPTAISRVVFPNGRQVDLASTNGRRVFSPGEAYAAEQVLKGVLTSPGATGTAAYYGCPAAGKTGTTNSFTDAYFDGFTSQLATAVWVGYPNSTITMPNGFGGTLAAPIWHDYMQAASNGFCGDFPVPAVRWQGHPFYGHFAATGRRAGAVTGAYGTGTAGGYTAIGPAAPVPAATGTGTGSGTPPSATAPAATGPAPAPAPAPTPGKGNGNGGAAPGGGAPPGGGGH
jgi:penicillin-binding protein 1A